MTQQKMWRLVCYDVRDDKRLRKVTKILSGYGRRLQYSIFCCLLSDTQTERMRHELKKVVDDEDSLMILGICLSCATRARVTNADIWPEDPKGHVIV